MTGIMTSNDQILKNRSAERISFEIMDKSSAELLIGHMA